MTTVYSGKVNDRDLGDHSTSDFQSLDQRLPSASESIGQQLPLHPFDISVHDHLNVDTSGGVSFRSAGLI